MSIRRFRSPANPLNHRPRALMRGLALASTLGLLLAGCSDPASSPPKETAPISWSLLDHAAESRTISTSEGAESPEARFDDERRLLALPAGGAVEFFLRLPEAPRLELQLLRGEGALQVELLSQDTDAAQSWTLEDRQQEIAVDLGSGSRLARLRLRATGGDVGIRDPRVVGLRPIDSSSSNVVKSGHPNLIVYLVDTLRADRIGVFGSTEGLTPRLDAFAEGATVVERSMAASPWTRPSVASIFTGRWPMAHGVNTKNSALPESMPTLAEILQTSGYRTAGFVSNRQVSEVFGFDRGFDVYREVQGDDHYLADSSAAIHTAAVDWLETVGEGDASAKPFFLYLHALDPHAPYAPVEPWRSRFAPGVETPEVTPQERRKLTRLERRLGKKSPTAEHFAPILGSVPWIMGLERGWLAPSDSMTEGLNALYNAEIATNDARFGELLDELEARGLADQTLVVFVTDHGEEFLEHGQWQHGKTFYDEVLRSATVLRAPNSWQTSGQAGTPPSRIATAGHPDLTITLLAAAGVPAELVPTGLEGRDLFGSEGGRSTPMFSWLDDDGRRGAAVVEGSFKLILWETPEVRQVLYDLDQDPAEKHNIFDQKPIVGGYLTSLLRGQRRRFGPPSGAREVEIDAETRARLEALGYV